MGAKGRLLLRNPRRPRACSGACAGACAGAEMELPVADAATAPDERPGPGPDQTTAHVSHATMRDNKVAARNLQVPMPVGRKREVRMEQWTRDNDISTDGATVVEEEGPDGQKINKYIFYARLGPPADATVADFRAEGTAVSGNRTTKRPDAP